MASSGIESEVVARATPVEIPGIGSVPVARAEELLALKVLSVTAQRRQDEGDAIALLLTNDAMDLASVRANLALMTARGFDRDQDLEAKLASILEAARRE